ATARSRRHVKVTRRSTRSTAHAARRMTSRRDPELSRRSGFRNPAGEQAVRYELTPGNPHALAIERPRTEPSRPERIVDDADAWREDRCSEFVVQETHLARDRRTADRAGKMTE